VGGAISGVALLVGVVLACEPAASPGATIVVAATPAVTASPTPPVATGGPSPTVPGRDSPPDALLAAEGGDPIAGQLGTYVWQETGSDSPWLPGAPLAVGAGEPLTLSVVPDGEIRAWAVRYVPAAAGGPEGATSLGEGAGSPRFDAPGPGAWTVEVFVEFAPGVGDARYFWRLEVE
jgi:hypothetical protein